MAAECRLEGATFGPIIIDEILDEGVTLPEGWTTHLEVPLSSQDSQDINLFEDGVLAEKGNYRISLRIDSDVDVQEVLFSVNDADDFEAVRNELPESHRGAYSYQFILDSRTCRKDDERHVHLFGHGTGFSRVSVEALFRDDSEGLLYSQDIVTLSGKEKENEEDESILEEMLHSCRNQAAEWMFSQPGDTAPNGQALSSDASTDWADDELESCMQAIDASFEMVRKGILDQHDSFPDMEGRLFDTEENRTVRAFLTSLVEQAQEMAEDLGKEKRRSATILQRIDRVVAQGKVRYGSKVYMPARAIFETRLGHISARKEALEELCRKIASILSRFDVYAPGIKKVDYVLPADDGAFAHIPAYHELRLAMCYWQQFADFDYKREKRELHAMKPDRLYEYYCLYRLLDVLYSMGFTERRDIDEPIRYFHYSIVDTYDDYENEGRCANTYQLAKRLPNGGSEQVDLYYVPVIYEDYREENGISLHRLTKDGKGYITYERRNAIWTPDYVMAIRVTDKPARTIMLDAKHISLEQIRDGETYGEQKDLLQKIRRKYLDRTGCGSKEMPRPEEAWLFCAYGNETSRKQGPVGLFRLDTQTENNKLESLLQRFGIEW